MVSAALLHRLARLDPERRAQIVRALPWGHARVLNEAWEAWANPAQREPAGDWRVWLIRAGRGFGKTRAGAEWVSAVARATPEARIALVGATADDVRRVMVEGESGLLAVARSGERSTWHPHRGEFTFDSGAHAYAFSAERPDRLRGPQHHAAWCDELAAWRWGDATWDNLMMGLRLGDAPRVLVTTTPRTVPLLRRVMALPGLYESTGATRDNPFLSRAFVADIEATYAGSRLGRQELEGEMIEDAQGSLWTHDLIDSYRVGVVPPLVRVVLGVDPPAGIGGDACGIVAAGKGEDGIAYVIEDASVAGASPEGWARAVADCAARNAADRVVVEVNQGGAMVSSVLRAVEAMLPIRPVHARHGKVRRAEPVAALYTAGRVRHVGGFPALEDEMCALMPGGGYAGAGRSPDRADALVWALWALMLEKPPRAARVRQIAAG